MNPLNIGLSVIWFIFSIIILRVTFSMVDTMISALFSTNSALAVVAWGCYIMMGLFITVGMTFLIIFSKEPIIQ